MAIRTWSAVAVVVVATAMVPTAARAVLIEVDDTTFVDYVDELKSVVFANGSNLYQPPSAQQLSDFRALAEGLWAATSEVELSALVGPADALGYDVVRLEDVTGTYFGVREQLNGGVQSVGWGSYFVRQGLRRDALVQAPHPLFDSNTPEVAARAFVQSQTRGFAMAGAHRNANGQGTADVAHLTDSVFQEVHESWNGPAGENIAWQVHGFKLENHLPDFPTDTDAVLSNGTGGVSPEIIALDAAIDALGLDWVSYAYNNLGVNDPLNTMVNGTVDGADFGPPGGLGATTNKQQLYSTGIGGTFVHIELEQSFRLDNGSVDLPLAADAIADAIIDTTALVPEPASALWLGVGGLVLASRRRAA